MCRASLRALVMGFCIHRLGPYGMMACQPDDRGSPTMFYEYDEQRGSGGLAVVDDVRVLRLAALRVDYVGGC